MKIIFSGKLKQFARTALFVSIIAIAASCSGGAERADSPGYTLPSDVNYFTVAPGNLANSLSWTDPSDAGLDHIEITSSSGSSVTVAKGTAAYTENGLINGTAYTYTIKTVHLDGSKSAGIQKSATPASLLNSHTVSGKAYFGSVMLRNVKITLIGDASSIDYYTDNMGNYSFNAVTSGFYTIVPVKTGWHFSPSSYDIMVTGSEVIGRDFPGGPATGYQADPWGNIWDTTAHAPANFAAATQDCADRGGRLPTPTELYRNNKLNGTNALADITETSYLWTNIEYDINNQMYVRLSDASVSYVAKTTVQAYRCIWPNISAQSFESGNINGPVGDESFSITINGVEYLIDKKDRAPLPWNAALRECEFYGGFLPSESFYAVAIQQGLPNGTGAWLHTSSFEGFYGANFMGGVVKWTGICTSFMLESPNNSSFDFLNNPHPFRCAATKRKFNISPIIIPNGKWENSITSLTSTVDDEVALNQVAAVDFCFERGGHLPNSMDYHMLISAGLPNGSNTNLWTSDYEKGNYVGVVSWSGQALSYDARYYALAMNPITWADPATSYKFRAVYYPLNNAYTGPADALFNGGKFESSFDIGGGNVTKTWTDKLDRDPALLGDALRICHELGGHLATKRDLVELIRHGLPNGSSIYLWTSDPGSDQTIETVKWTGTGSKTTFTDLWGISTSEVAKDSSTVRPFRCVWTNEVRVR